MFVGLGFWWGLPVLVAALSAGLLVSFGQKQMSTIAASVAGLMIAFYQLGYGLAAFALAPRQG